MQISPGSRVTLHFSLRLADGMLVVADGLDWLHAFDASSGKLRWELRSGVAIDGGIAVAGNKLLLGTRRGEVIAYAVKDGAVLWRAPVSREHILKEW